ncbi:MAG: hypothetical protein COU65_01620 [Candidatus Pacebacteria bacterium CG10_big_fil_rev_8_21_14_0_10_42_12]|nr:hypothetical protein [Candidatus Paceibacterota bacterium]PIR62777.1 MAG: hypothetical protein COU65_01620 [Candidatus Pacebacteria bacterium CG10_big_fil_rev_8_21_14_0_10_42_12]
MLSKRTNILFEEEMWTQLSSLAKKQKTSVGDLVREAVKMQYIQKESAQEQRKRRRMAALQIMKEVGSRMKGGPLTFEEFKELRDMGKK